MIGWASNMKTPQFFAVIVCGVALRGNFSSIRGQAPDQAAPAPAALAVAPPKLPLTYVSAKSPADLLQLNGDNSFLLQEAGQIYHGTFSVDGNTLELRIFESNANTTALMQDGKLTDSSGQIWILGEKPSYLGTVTEVVRNRDVIRLVKAGLDDEIVVAKIGSSSCQFDTSPQALASLRRNGLSAAVIGAMTGSGTMPASGEGPASTMMPATTGASSAAGVAAANSKIDNAASDVGTVRTQASQTQDQHNKTIADLKSVTGDLGVQSGLIATNGKELAALRLKGERNYTDIKLGKTKQPQRFGDIALRLDNVTPKRNMYSVYILADDKLTFKQNKNINEPVQFYAAKGGHTPYELVINQVTKDTIVGYLSAPKNSDGSTPVMRIYIEFNLGQGKQPQRFGEIVLRLIKVNTEADRYSVEVIDDGKVTLLEEKRTNEICEIKSGRTVYDLVVNRVASESIAGYLWREPAIAAAENPEAVRPKSERTFVEVRLGITRQPQRFGDIALRLESVDPKRKTYSVYVLAGDKLTFKQGKSINEPVQFYTAKGGDTPYELVINQVAEDSVAGYLSTPR